ncbi:MAG: outer membrane protein assembly factor BamD [Holosporaceae bacterium]|nr:outer membrane protein assembly factor BamD [Holosporaceae bacterium]
MNRSFKLLCCLGIVGCASEKEDFKDRTPESIYKKALILLQENEYTDAASEFKDIEILFPYSSKAHESQILSAYCFFLASSYMDALREIAIFLRYHPSHELVPYAMYLKAMCLYMQIASVGRDSKKAMDAKRSFLEVINKFPYSPYRDDSLKRIALLDDIIVAHEMSIGRYYQRNKSYLAAMGRYNFIINQLPRTNHTSEALYRLIECCFALGLTEEAENTRQALELSYPHSQWIQKAAALRKK